MDRKKGGKKKERNVWKEKESRERLIKMKEDICFKENKRRKKKEKWNRKKIQCWKMDR